MELSNLPITSNLYDWVVIAVSSTPSKEEVFFQFLQQFPVSERIVVYHLYPQKHPRQHVYLDSVMNYYLNHHSPKHDAQFEKVIGDILNKNKKILLFASSLPYMPLAFISTVSTYHLSLGTQLFVLGHFSKDSIAVLYNPLFLLAWQKSLLLSGDPPLEHEDFCRMPKTCLLYPPMMEHFLFLGKLFANCNELSYKDLDKKTRPNFHDQPFLKVVHLKQKLEVECNHTIFKGNKIFNPQKSDRRNQKPLLFKMFMLSTQPVLRCQNALTETFIEVVTNEFLRILVPRSQPKTRFAYSPSYDAYGIMITEIDNFISLQSLLNEKNSNNSAIMDGFKKNINRVGFAKLLIASVWFGEFDLRLDNLGTSRMEQTVMYKVDQGCCLPRVREKYKLHDKNPIKVNFDLRITTTLLQSLPKPKGYPAYNWLLFNNSGQVYSESPFF